MDKKYVSYFKEQIKTFRVNFIRSKSRKNFEAIHDYRVALKRIRNLINFLRHIPGGKDLKNCYKINHLQLAFKSGGILREMQINRIKLNGYESQLGMKFNGFRNFIGQREANALTKLEQARHRFSAKKLSRFEKKVARAMEHISSSTFLKHVDQFIEKRIGQIRELVNTRHVESALHRIRRHTKSIKYLLEMTKAGTRNFGNLKFEFDIITALEDLIGDWHDLQVFKIDLDQYIATVESRRSIEPELRRLRSVVERDYKKIFKKTVQAVYDHYQIAVQDVHRK